MSRLRQLGHPLAAFMLGVAATFVAAAFLSSDSDPAHPVSAALRWGLRERSPGRLVIPLPGADRMVLDMSCEPSSALFRSLALADGEGILYDLVQCGEYGCPEASYRGGRGADRVLWVDLNVDGRFDERYLYAKVVMEIRMAQEWVAATMEGSTAVTEKGRFVFDPGLGEWQAGDSGTEAHEDRAGPAARSPGG